MGSLGPLNPAEMDVRWEEARRLLHQNGVTYNIYGDPQGMERPWPLDMMPLLLPAHEWKVIEAGLIQRATLLNGILADLYGPQTLIRNGRLPAAAVLADPGFRRPLHGLRVPGDLHLHFYAADLARAPDGQWQVLSDRTQAPSGSGYALENRLVMAKVLPDSFHHCQVSLLSGFFDGWKETLLGLGDRRTDTRVVLLTPGPYNETYFEHVYLARQLGITLVEGGDLTVRDRQVFHKTLSGLERVDVILRRLDADYSDPLELRVDSSLGVAGLIEAVRAGTVVVANALGAGLMESMAIKPMLPTLCRDLLGEDLKLKSVPIWWCGNDADRAHVIASLDDLVIKPAFPSLPFEPIFGQGLSVADRQSLIDRIHARPWNYVAQDRVALSTAPVWHNDLLEARPLVLRAFVCARADGGYSVMPGGLTRISTEAGRLVVSMQSGGGSKDTWILADKPGEAVAIPPRRRQNDDDPLAMTRELPPDLSSRVADSMFWLGRYAERAESGVRLLRAIYNRMPEAGMPGATAQLRPLLDVMAFTGMIPWELTAPPSISGSLSLRNALYASVMATDHPTSLRSQIQRLHRSAYTVRDRLSLDMWRVISSIDRHSEPPVQRPDSAALMLRLDDLMISLAALSGLEQESMTRGPGWRFLELGRRIERSVHIVATLQGMNIAGLNQNDEATETAVLTTLLELGESVMSYRSRYLTTIRRCPALALLLTGDGNPRSLSFQLRAIEAHLQALPHTSAADGPAARATDILATARTNLSDEQVLTDSNTLRQMLDHLASSLPELSNLLTQAYFSHAFARSA